MNESGQKQLRTRLIRDRVEPVRNLGAGGGGGGGKGKKGNVFRILLVEKNNE